MKPPKEILERLAKLEGWIDIAECELLYDLASQIDDYCIVEIGSYRGKSTVSLGLGSLAGYGVNVYAIEPHLLFVSAAGSKFDGPKDKVVFLDNLPMIIVTGKHLHYRDWETPPKKVLPDPVPARNRFIAAVDLSIDI